MRNRLNGQTKGDSLVRKLGIEMRRWLVALPVILYIPAAAAQVYEITPNGDMVVIGGGGSVRNSSADANLQISPSRLRPVPVGMREAVVRAAERRQISPQLLEALVWQESRWRADAVSPKGARGLTQLMPGTARTLGVDPRDPVSSLDGGAHYLRLMLDHFDGNLELALAAYNAGPAKVERRKAVPRIPETVNFVGSIMDRLSRHALQPCVAEQTCSEPFSR